MSDAVAVLMRAAGALVALGGLAVLMLLAVERFAGPVLAAFGAASAGHAAARRLGLAAVALVTFAAGLALAALHAAAPALMLAAAAAQALGRLAARKYFPDGDTHAPGRDAARLGLMAHLAVTALVLIVDWQRPEIWRDGGDAWLAVAVAAVAMAAWLGRMLARRDAA